MAADALEVATVKRALTGVDAVAQSLGVSAGPEIIFASTRLFSKASHHSMASNNLQSDRSRTFCPLP
jgi:hypothetical protein